VTSQRTLSALLGSGINLVHVTVRLAPDGAADISHTDCRPYCLHWCGFQLGLHHTPISGFIPYDPIYLLFTLRTPRYHDARKTRCWPVCSTLARPDFHRQADTSFPNAARTGLFNQCASCALMPNCTGNATPAANAKRR